MPRHTPPRALALLLALLCTVTGLAAVVTTASSASASSSASAGFTPMRPGDTAWRVRVLQSRLHQLDLHSEVVTNRFDEETRAGVATFQRRRGWTADGVVDERTWTKIVALTSEPTTEALHNVYTPGRPLLERGDTGMWVRQVQARLTQLRWYDAPVTGRFTGSTVEAVEGFQAKRRIPVTGQVDRRTLTRLKEMTRVPTRAELFNIVPSGPALDPRCTTGRALCVDKTSRSLRWVVDGVVLRTVEVRFGSDELPTREGDFSVFRKSRDHVSSLYDTPMPFAMFFSGGQAVHYSPDFAANGYNGASHGCVNVRDRAAVAWLFDQVRIGDRVVVYRS
ncbi:Peptidoglycan-binding (PGRP) domain of peptidoglycan hydrolases-containing protein [Nocardioides alpinus]|uniref:Peptidoglycan-binding (PGRP) domain of peptidoglycan hydrolases-containing protein n=2 Tax=Nocardioides alpinus TaxID=748909 RepID=A0A1I0YXA1_9ACTN|nr:L,D-transpeptidase family protein [Nocardioides alpinus]SFB18029.1 Peptidoglycan-binding (PGRP) domain of peptidoglycan hydrolases-containing protein [Nocardioides alpinus]